MAGVHVLLHHLRPTACLARRLHLWRLRHFAVVGDIGGASSDGCCGCGVGVDGDDGETDGVFIVGHAVVVL